MSANDQHTSDCRTCQEQYPPNGGRFAAQDTDLHRVETAERDHFESTGHRVFARQVNFEPVPDRRLPAATDPDARNRVRERIGQDIYSAVEKAPMSFVADGGRSALLLAELAIRRLEDAGWTA